MARGPYAEALSLYRAAGDSYGIAHALQGLGLVAVEQGDASEGEGRLRECLALQREIGDRPGLEATFEGLAGVAALRARTEGRPSAERALRLAGVADAGREAHPEWGWRLWEAPLAEPWLAPAFAALGGRGAPAAEAARAAGRAMTAEEAIEYALSGAAE